MFHNYCLAPHFSDPSSLFHLNWDDVSKHELLCSRQSYFLNALYTFLLILVTWKDILRRSHQFKGQSFRDLQLFYSHYSTITSLVQIFLSISFRLISSTNTKRPLPSSSTKHTGKMLSCHFTGTFLETRKISVKNCSCCSLQEMRNAENAACLGLFHQQDASHCFCWLHKFQATKHF